MKDLLVLAADKDIEFSLRALLSRPASLGIREISFDTFVHNLHDPGCLGNPELVISGMATRYRFGLIVFDREGCGEEGSPPAELAARSQAKVVPFWEDRVKSIVIDPEVEVWIWSDSPHVDRILGWEGKTPSLREWLVASNQATSPNSKPADPKNAFLQATAKVGTPKSSSLFFQLASSVSFNRCTDASFTELKSTLIKWFPPT